MKLTAKNCLLFSVLFLSACGKSKVEVRNLEVKTSQSESITYVNMDADLKLGNLKLPNSESPIVDPNTNKNFGIVRLSASADGVSHLKISVDAEALTKTDSEFGHTLPNGRELPSEIGVSNTALIGFPIFKNSRVYIGGNIKGELYVGAALTVSQLDRIFIKYGYPLNVFYSYPFGDQLIGFGGMFTSMKLGESGFGVFAKKSMQTSFEKSNATMVADDLKLIKARTWIKLDRLLNQNSTLDIQ